MVISKEQYAIARSNGISNDTTYNRVYNCGWDVEKAITKPVRKKVDVDYPEGLEKNGISKSAYYARIKKGWEPERAATEPYKESSRKALKMVHEKNRKYPKKYVKLAIQNGLTYEIFANRMRAGWKLEDAATKTKGTKLRKIRNEKIDYRR
ncbi:hypothetical protein J2Z32_004484 [Paenibacillus turicensis]|uniref:Uncharacterized protein n=1 Tax=Paenibacillus turicensis TaxID=160487 RepID=A0ABS4FZ33_9BACL|nr:nucleoside permease [Paenibacillus turicensis]MBP1907795.1 hypothetical protein [Paenibacillus turicensis]